MPEEFALHRPTEDDWQAIRDLRIRAVTDTPNAYLETLEQVRTLDEEGWRARARRNSDPGTHQVVAVSPNGRWVGSMICFLSDGPPSYIDRRQPAGRRANLVGVFVDPKWRGGAGVTDALLDDIVQWVRDVGFSHLYLHVNTHNTRACRSYEKRGFRPTGFVDPIPGQPDTLEIEMALELGGYSR